MAFPPKDKAPKPDLALMIGTDDEDAPEAPAEEAGLPTSAKAAAVKAFYSAGQEGDWEAAASALGEFIDAHDDALDEEEPVEPEAPPSF